MDKDRIIEIGESINTTPNVHTFLAKQAEIKNFIAVVSGKNNSFYEAATKINITAIFAPEQLKGVIDSFLKSVKNDLISNASYERKIQINVVNDYLAQAEDLLDKKEFHPSTSAILIGASLEEFLRNWAVDQNLLTEETKPSIDGYATILKKEGLIDKQDHKEITAWAGLRNNAAHGYWDLVSDHDKISHMLSGVNLFIKKYST
ncbi:HepT-like ribonuclease domain-containing protein [Paraflavitalea soli]|nr:HepT-like ribonuclease domain-containing protein [Paraflavitalea soli]